MRYIILFAAIIIFATSCKKDKFTTVPQLTYKSISPSTIKGGSTTTGGVNPVLSFEITDNEGDLGLKAGKDSSFIYVKNLRTNLSDSLLFPNINLLAQKNFTATIEVLMEKPVFINVSNPTVKDTIFYEVYVKDFAKNKSNVIKCGPLYYVP
jgi:hypothetical protein